MDRIFKLLSEPSTYAGIAAALAGMGMFALSETQWLAIGGALAGIFGAVAAFMLDSADK